MSFSETISPLIGRWALAWFYLTGALNATHDWHVLAGHMLARHVPLPPLVLMVGLVLVLLGVVSLVFGKAKQISRSFSSIFLSSIRRSYISLREDGRGRACGCRD